jgi:hypothetical protein
MKKILIIVILCLFWIGHLEAATNTTELWKQAAEYYQQRAYQSAANIYEQLGAQKPANADVYYNLGNTYYRLNKIGLATLNYERALRIDPNHTLAKDNLLLTRKRMTTEIKYAEDIFFIKWWTELTSPHTATPWAVFAFLCFVLMVSLFLLKLLGGDKVKLPVQLPYIVGFVWLLMLVPAFASAAKVKNSGRAVVMVNDSPLNPTEQKGKPLSQLPEGTTVVIKQIKGDQAEVVIPDGRTGWLQLSVVTQI